VSKRGPWLIESVSKAEITKQGYKLRKIVATAEKVKWVQVGCTRGAEENTN